MVCAMPDALVWNLAQRGACVELEARLQLPIPSFGPEGLDTVKIMHAAMHVAARNDHADALKLMLEWCKAHGIALSPVRRTGLVRWRDYPLLHIAASFGSVHALAVLIAYGTGLDTPFYGEYWKGTTTLTMALCGRQEAAVELLLRVKARVDAVATTLCPLLTAAKEDWVWGVKRLLEAKADANAPNGDFGETAVRIAVTHCPGPACLRALLDARAAVNILATEDGRSPLHLAVRAGGRTHIVYALLAARADVGQVTAVARLESFARDGDTAFLMAAERRPLCPTMLRALLKAKSDIHARDRNGCSAVRRAIQLEYDDTVEWLLRAKADVDK
jgi:hypothetical protein